VAPHHTTLHSTTRRRTPRIESRALAVRVAVPDSQAVFVRCRVFRQMTAAPDSQSGQTSRLAICKGGPACCTAGCRSQHAPDDLPIAHNDITTIMRLLIFRTSPNHHFIIRRHSRFVSLCISWLSTTFSCLGARRAWEGNFRHSACCTA
jgi:hypothetical protein